MVPQITTHFLYNTKLIQHLVVHTITYFNIGHNSIANDTHDNRPSHKAIVVQMTATTTHWLRWRIWSSSWWARSICAATINQCRTILVCMTRLMALRAEAHVSTRLRSIHVVPNAFLLASAHPLKHFWIWIRNVSCIVSRINYEVSQNTEPINLVPPSHPNSFLHEVIWDIHTRV